MNFDNRKLVVVIGAGRTGSSLLTRMLIKCGMVGSDNYVKSVEHNPEGVFEDGDILGIHKEIFSFLDIYPYSPVPENVLNIEGINVYIKKLKDVVGAKVSESEGVWGFKDPRTASLMPLWLRVFNPLKLVPKYILTVRNPSSVVASMNKQFNDSSDAAELVWLIRTCDALYYSGGNCFIVHYEDWFTDKASGMLDDLVRFIGLKGTGVTSKEAVSSVVKKSLNRSAFESYEIKNIFAKKLYKEILKCSGDDFDRERLMSVVIECRQAIQFFSPLAEFAKKQQTYHKKNNEEYLEEIKIYKKDNVRLTEKENQLLSEQIEKNKILEEQEIAIQNLQAEILKKEKGCDELIESLNRKVSQIKKEAAAISSSTSYRLGLVFVHAVTRPGKNTLLLPVNVFKIFWHSFIVKR